MNHADTPAAVERVLDDPLAPLRNAGIGFVGPDIPVEALLATGRPYGHLPWKAAQQTPWADGWLESSFPFWARSILEQWHAGDFDELQTVVFSRADDATQRLYYYVAELQRRKLLRGPVPQMFDIALVRRDSSIEHTAAAVLKLCRVLEIEPVDLRVGIERANALRRALTNIHGGRHGQGPVYERLGRAALWSDATAWIEEIVISEHAPTAQRVLLAGSVPPDDRLHRAIEAAGASVVAEAHVYGPDRLGPEVLIAGEGPEQALARQLHAASASPRAMLDRARWIVERARAADAAAVVVWLTREDEALAWHVPAQGKALAAAGLPTLLLPASHWQLDDPTLNRLNEFFNEASYAAT